jgi:hypothetical protein
MPRGRRGFGGGDVPLVNPFACPAPPPPPDILVASNDEASGKSSLFTIKRRMTSSLHSSPRQTNRAPVTDHRHATQSARSVRPKDPLPASSPRDHSHNWKQQQSVSSMTRHSTFSNSGIVAGEPMMPPMSALSSAVAAPLPPSHTSNTSVAGGGHGGGNEHALLYLDSSTSRLVSRLIPGREYYGGVYFAPPPTMALDRVLTSIHVRDTQAVNSFGLPLPKLFGGGHTRGTAASVLSDDSEGSGHHSSRRPAPSESPSRHTISSAAANTMPSAALPQDLLTPAKIHRPAPPGLSSWAAPAGSQADTGITRPSHDYSLAGSAGPHVASFLESGVPSLDTTLTAQQPHPLVMTPAGGTGGMFRGTIASRRQLRQPTVALEEPL